jgi:hypothetical protein
MNLSKHFTREELIFSAMAVRHGIANEPSTALVENNLKIAATYLEQLRGLIKKPVNVISCYRSEKVNKLVGGSMTSAHMMGAAADIRVEGYRARDLMSFIIDHDLDHDQLICEFDSWVHWGFKVNDRARGELLVAKKQNGKTVYTRYV